MRKKAFSLIEVMIVLAISGVFLSAVYAFYTKSVKISSTKTVKKRMQRDARVLIERFYMDVQGAYKVNGCDEKSLSLELFQKTPGEATLKYEPETETVEYVFDGDTITRNYKDKTTTFYNVKSLSFKYLTVEFKDKKFDLVETDDPESVVAVVINVKFEEKGEKFEVVSSAFLKCRNMLYRYGMKSPYKYFSSLEDDSF